MGFLKEYEALSSADARRALLFQWLNAHRHELFAELRDNAPVFAAPDFFLVTRYEDAKNVLTDAQHFSVRAYPTSGAFVLGKDKADGHDVDRQFLSELLPAVDHQRVRDIAARKAQEIIDAALGKEEAILAVVQKDPVLNRIVSWPELSRGRLDLPTAFARLVPLAVVEEYFGVLEPNPADFGVLPLPRHPDPVVTKLQAAARPLLDPNFPSLDRWTSALSRAFRYTTFDQYFSPNLALARTLSERALQVRKDFSNHLGDLLANPSTAQGSDTLVKRLVKGIGTDDRSLEQTVRDVMGMIGGMIDNVADATCSTIDVLLSHPSALESAIEIAQQIKHAPAHQVEPLRDKLWQYIREALRFAPPVPFIPRTPADDWQHPSGVVVPQWRRMFVAIGSAMMDERKIAHPNEFRLNHLDHEKQQPFVEDDDLFFGSGWHDCFGRDIAREQVIEMVRSLLLLPNLRRTPGIVGQVEYEHFAPKRLTVEFGPQPVQNALTAVMTIKPPEEAHYRALKLLLSQAYGPVEQLLNQVGTVHFARFIFLENNTKLALITTFDGEFDTYIKNYIELAGPLFDLMLDHMKDAPPLPVRAHRNEFVDYVRRCDIGSETPFYSTYGDLTVQEILGEEIGMAERDFTTLQADDLRDIQGLILLDYNMPLVRHFLIKVERAQEARRFLGALASENAPVGLRITTAADQREKYCLNIGLTYTGLKALGLPATVIDSFASTPAYVAGAAARAWKVGDHGESAPERWWPDEEETRPQALEIHLLLSLYAQYPQEKTDLGSNRYSDPVRKSILDTQATRLKELFRHSLSVVWEKDGEELYDPNDPHSQRPGKLIHFDFKDGISQPQIAGAPPAGPAVYPTQAPVSPGAFLFGYASQWTSFCYPVPRPEQFGRNGSFAVFRVMTELLQS